jgi:hypothetical protein
MTPVVEGPNDRLNPKTNHITLSNDIPKNICIKIETTFFFLNKPDSNKPRAGIINNTKHPAISIHAVSPVSMGIMKFGYVFSFNSFPI